MRIAILSTTHWRTPPVKYGPWELIASYIAEGMVARGHDVTLYATGDSITSGKLKSVCPRPIMEDSSLEPKIYQYLHTAAVFEDADQFDIIHNHFDAYPLAFSKLVKTPVVTTIHGFSSPQVPELFKRYQRTSLVSISLADRIHAPDLKYAANIYHGIPIADYTFQPEAEDYLCYVGRISPDKGVAELVQLAAKQGWPLKLAGLLDSANQAYFDREIKPHLSSTIEYLGQIEEADKRTLIGKAKVFMHLNNYPEGFGLTLIEAMACGTPVIGMNRGSVAEVVAHGETGFVANTIEEVPALVERIHEIKRTACRARVEQLFTVDRMVDDYEQLYKRIVNIA